ncbi:MAG: adenylate/guanylate cyclase domain-containing protein [Firmicutes bacterium]|nr:adenylate/guanylate cyclase domain-containing protein [Bacillota bacterium]
MSKKTTRKLITALLVAAVITGAVWLGALDRMDGTVSDALYHHNSAIDGQVVVVGMDQRAVDALGPMPWPRDVMADAIMYLNSDPDNKPAAIALDVLYVGASSDPDADAALVEAAELGGNVVAASAGTFGSQLQVDGDSFYMSDRSVLAWDSPFDELLAVSETGHINAMPDTDGIIRHAMYTVDVPDIGPVKPFARVIYEKYCRFHGLEICREPVTTDGFFYLPYTAMPGSYYDGISIIDLINGDIEPDYFAGKIVLIGPYTMGMQDEYRTSIDHASTMYGIEIQANQIDAYRKGFLPQDVTLYPQLALLFLMCVAAMFFFLDSPVTRALIGWIAACGIWLGICYGSYKAGYVLHALWIPLAVTVLFIACVALNYIRAAREKRKVTSTFGRYVDPAIMNELLAEGSAAETLGGRNFDIAVLFVDIRGFTTMSESLPPATVVEIINKYLTLTTECIMRHHGTLDKFVGDCTMAFWNAPVAQEDCVYLACQAAMDMVVGAKPLAEELQERFGRSVSFGVGVHYGPAVVGNIGAPQRMDFTAIGDTVNTASRLESNAPAGTIYISRIVADMLGDRAKTTSLGATIKLKGKAEGFEVLTLDSLE